MSTDVLSSATEQFPSTVAAPAGGDARTSASVRTPMQSLINGVLWLRRRLEEVVGKFLPLGGLFPVAASVGSSTFTIAGHGLSANDPVLVMSVGGAVPSPLVAGTTYYAVTVATDTFQVAATSGGGAITLTDNGTGSIYVAKRVSPNLYGVAPTASPTFTGTVTQPGATALTAPLTDTRITATPIFDPTNANVTLTGSDVTTASTAVSTFHYVLPVPNGAILTNVKVYLKGASGHGALPAIMPSMTITARNITTGAVTTVLASTPDGSASTAAYEAAHSIDSGVLATTVDRTVKAYVVSVTTEGSTNAASGAKFYGVQATWTRSTMGDD